MSGISTAFNDDLRLAGDVFDAPAEGDSAFTGSSHTDPFEIARVEKMREMTPNGMRIRVAGYDDSKMAGNDFFGADEATSATRDWTQGEYPSYGTRIDQSGDRIGREPEFINPGAPQQGEPGFSGRALDPGKSPEVAQDNLNWIQEVDSDEAADRMIRGIGERDERGRREAFQSTFGLAGPSRGAGLGIGR